MRTGCGQRLTKSAKENGERIGRRFPVASCRMVCGRISWTVAAIGLYFKDTRMPTATAAILLYQVEKVSLPGSVGSK